MTCMDLTCGLGRISADHPVNPIWGCSEGVPYWASILKPKTEGPRRSEDPTRTAVYIYNENFREKEK